MRVRSLAGMSTLGEGSAGRAGLYRTAARVQGRGGSSEWSSAGCSVAATGGASTSSTAAGVAAPAAPAAIGLPVGIAPATPDATPFAAAGVDAAGVDAAWV